MLQPPTIPLLFPYTTLFRSNVEYSVNTSIHTPTKLFDLITNSAEYMELWNEAKRNTGITSGLYPQSEIDLRSEEHTSELQSREKLVCRLLLEKKKKRNNI